MTAQPATDTATRTPAPVTGPTVNPRRHRLGGLIGLVAALGAGGVLLALPTADPDPSPGTQVRTIEQVWPDARPVEIPAALSDGPAYSPVFFLDARASVGTAPSPEGTHLRLVLRAADGTIRELRRLPIADGPVYAGFARDGDEFAWAESVPGADGHGRTEVWAANLATAQPARRLTADTGDVVFFNSQYDMVINSGRLYWASVAPDEETATEIRSVALTGGAVSVRTEQGAWSVSAYPWLVSAGTGTSGPVQLRNLEQRKVIEVDATGSELVTCSPTWCRVLVLAADGPGRIELMRPDGTDRQQVAGGVATAAVIDVAVLDRFEVVSLADAQRTATDSQQLLLYDVREKRTVVVSDGSGLVLCRDGILWWSTGGSDVTAWHTLDLRTLK
ncbi:hypothetical protein [Micromonospora sp. NBC_01796]|uniref:hypothetical protein n=1 Tax=Micromonospora sp. NBC_01796 TaxID=2975987 RepID=UPI002DD94716|nr:hypothetical protein [Micromonospora sp. NBC_01796]WSA89082.1 hypothetical protein OIE47_16525 [Micromonospora sp. NBC_01796]